ncbi:hypothetical protein HID58_016905 [Brassica napus]|uniref:Uncharacterized protein n=1 Tax=Brassica napus TaxID=3708 RepID=A0ABQ8D5J3_BRANA|nr:hypothetical protein HID58_016905 [Brassica napus]
MRSGLGPAYGRRVSDRAIAGTLFSSFKVSFLLFLRFLSSIALSKLWFWPSLRLRGGSASGVKTRSYGGSRRWKDVSPDQGSIPGGGGFYSSVVAGLSPGGGGFVNSVVAGLVSGMERLTQLRRRRLLSPEGRGSQSSTLPAWNP